MAFPTGKNEVKQVACVSCKTEEGHKRHMARSGRTRADPGSVPLVILPAESQRKASSWRQSREASLLEQYSKRPHKVWMKPGYEFRETHLCWALVSSAHLISNADSLRGDREMQRRGGGKTLRCLKRTGSDLCLSVRWWPGPLNPWRDSSDYMGFLHNAAYDQVIFIFLYSQWRAVCIFRMQSTLV